MMATFKCKQSGNTLSFSDECDISSMRKEPHYEEIGNEISAIKTYSENSDSTPQDRDWQSDEDSSGFYAKASPNQGSSNPDAETKENAGVLNSELNIKKRGRPAKIQFEI